MRQSIRAFLTGKVPGSRVRRRDSALYDVYFDAEWYLLSNDDVARAYGGSPHKALQHYLDHGWKEHRNPNRFFDTAWYLKQDTAPVPGEPLAHYVRTGWKVRRSPHPHFDISWYLDEYADVRAAEVEPLRHYLEHGKAEGRQPHPEAYLHATFINGRSLRLRDDPAPHAAKSVPGYLALSAAPLVSVIITNRNGAAHIPVLLESLSAQTYRNFETIFVDDGSTDNSRALVASYPFVRLVANRETMGFAASNNVGVAASSGELIAPLNNDTRLDPNWLEHMVRSIRRSSRIAAVAPRIRFWSQFHRLAISGVEPFAFSRQGFVASLAYQKYFIREGREDRHALKSARYAGGHRLVVDIPIQAGRYRFEETTGRSRLLVFDVGGVVTSWHFGPQSNVHDYAMPRFAQTTGFHVINNAGSVESGELTPLDRGFGCVDDGQFDREREVDYLCGCSALIRRDALHGQELFVPEFQAYYEDSELSKRLTSRGYSIVYEPRAIVYHRHSATNVERSAFWRTATFRNEALFRYMHSDRRKRDTILPDARKRLDRWREMHAGRVDLDDGEKGFLANVPTIVTFLERTTELVRRGEIPRKAGLRIGVFNQFWNTSGGGEAHALDIATVLAAYGRVELISTEDFNIGNMLQYFSVPDRGFTKRLVSDMRPEVTAEYDVFVNSCYWSEVPSLAAVSYFIVSFPSRTPSTDFLRSYYFLANSRYTLSWMNRYWGEGSFRGQVLYPSIPSRMHLASPPASEKQKIVLSVGRFSPNGHSKNQLLIAEVFSDIVRRSADRFADWSLVLIGSTADQGYLDAVRQTLAGVRSTIIADAAFEQVRDYYALSAIYVHASGYGKDETSSPELFEHFGMAVAQALGSGCQTLVFGAGGPQEIVETTGMGHTFRTRDELAHELERLMQAHDEGRSSPLTPEDSKRTAVFSRSAQTEALKRLLERDLGWPARNDANADMTLPIT